jgi:hypothetical protein
MTPEVLGPGALPWLEPDEVREAPVVGMLSTLAHVEDPRCAEQALETLQALASWDEDADGRLADMLEAALPVAVRERMEELMRTGKYEYQSDFAKKYFALGREEGRTTALLLVLRSRGIEIPGGAERRIEEERDPARLDRWIHRAATADTIDEVLADE